MKDVVYRQKNIILDAILLGIAIIVATCVVPMAIIFEMSIIIVCISVSLLVSILMIFLLIIRKNTIGICNDGIIFKKRKKIIWKNILNVEIRIHIGKSIIVHYIFATMDCKINVYSNPELLKILLNYCNNNEKIKEILLQYNNELEEQLGW